MIRPRRPRPPAAALEHGYPARAERWIATGRAVLAAVPPVVWWLGAFEQTAHPRFVHVLIWGYVAYAWLLAALISEMRATRPLLQIVTHAVDLAMYALFAYLFEGQGSPFSFYFGFTVVAAAIRWGWRGTVWTAVVALSLYGGITLYYALQPETPIELYRWVFRVTYLGVVAALVGYLGAYEAEWRREVSRLAVWSPRLSEGPREMLRGSVADAAEILKAKRMVLVWEAEENPTVNIMHWTPDAFDRTREPPSALQGLVADPLHQTSFFCLDAGLPGAPVWHIAPEGVRRWYGAPLRRDFQERFRIQQVLAIQLKDELVNGYLFALDRSRMTADDLLIGQVVARELVAELVHLVLTARLRRAAVNEERLRLAGDLHDGLLQSLTAAALEVQAAREKLRSDPKAAEEDLEKVQGLIRGEQHDLRFLIEALRPETPKRRTHDVSLAARLGDFAATVEKVWQVAVRLDTQGLAGGFAIHGEHEVYRMVQEAVINAARHAGAGLVRVDVRRGNGRVQVAVRDDGHGFPFQGRWDHTALAAQNLGPVSLRQRVTRLGGAITITSAPSGAAVEIDLPLRALEG